MLAVDSHYSDADGLPGTDLTGWGARFKSRRGEMFFAGFAGAAGFFPDKFEEAPYGPQVVLADLEVPACPPPSAPTNTLFVCSRPRLAVPGTNPERHCDSSYCRLIFAPPVALNFWRAEPRGFLYLFRALEDDMSRAPIGPEPMKTLEIVVGTLRVTEFILVAIAIAKSLPMRRPPKLLMLTHAIQVTRSPQPFSPF
jgi:hypothetical protein